MHKNPIGHREITIMYPGDAQYCIPDNATLQQQISVEIMRKKETRYWEEKSAGHHFWAFWSALIDLCQVM